MPSEYREVRLSDIELIEAFLSYRRVTPTFLPEGQIIHCQSKGEVTSVTVKMCYGTTEQNATFEIDDGAVTQAMIRFCVENNVCLPEKGKKTVKRVRGGIALCIALVHAAEVGELAGAA